jgi:hypothetical protein
MEGRRYRQSVHDSNSNRQFIFDGRPGESKANEALERFIMQNVRGFRTSGGHDR